jgi:hypothetical protein
MVLVLHIEHAVSKKYNIMKKKFKQWWSGNNSTNVNKTNDNLWSQIIEHKKRWHIFELNFINLTSVSLESLSWLTRMNIRQFI